MNQLATIVKRYSYVATAAVLSLGMLMPLILGSSAGAAQLTNRSVTIESAEAGANGLQYEIAYEVATAGNIQSIMLDFCDEATGPIIGTTCSKPATMTPGTTLVSVTKNGGATTAVWTVSTQTANGVKLTGNVAESFAAGDDVVITLDGFTNPNEAQPATVYTRILTYLASTGPNSAATYAADATGTTVDDGAAAFAIVPTVNVSATVRETLTFCVGGGRTADATLPSITDGCAPYSNAGGGGDVITPPSIKLGDDSSGIAVLDELDVYTGDIFYQLTTNAATGADIRVKGEYNELRSGATNAIPSIGNTPTAIVAGTAGFGMNVFAPGTGLTADAAFGSDTVEPYTFAMPTDVTTTYGDVFATAAAPVRNSNGRLMFGATASPDTKAGVYSAQYTLIASPKY